MTVMRALLILVGLCGSAWADGDDLFPFDENARFTIGGGVPIIDRAGYFGEVSFRPVKIVPVSVHAMYEHHRVNIGEDLEVPNVSRRETSDVRAGLALNLCDGYVCGFAGVDADFRTNTRVEVDQYMKVPDQRTTTHDRMFALHFGLDFGRVFYGHIALDSKAGLLIGGAARF